MGIVKVEVAVCDICGAQDMPYGRGPDDHYGEDLPDGWLRITAGVFMCRACAECLAKAGRILGD